MFLTFFRVLKTASNSPLLPAVLEGVARWCHLLNVDFMFEIVHALLKLLQQASLPLHSAFFCAITAFQVFVFVFLSTMHVFCSTKHLRRLSKTLEMCFESICLLTIILCILVCCKCLWWRARRASGQQERRWKRSLSFLKCIFVSDSASRFLFGVCS